MFGFLLGYLVAVNLVAFCMYGIDKRKAVKDRYRISENALLGVALIGGSIGAWAGMKIFRHKTQKWKFKLLVPLFFLLQVAAVVYFVYWLMQPGPAMAILR